MRGIFGGGMGNGGYKNVLSMEKHPWEALISSWLLLLFKCRRAVSASPEGDIHAGVQL